MRHEHVSRQSDEQASRQRGINQRGINQGKRDEMKERAINTRSSYLRHFDNLNACNILHALQSALYFGQVF